MKKNIDIFSKDYQKQLKERYSIGLKDVWKKDSKMIDWEMKQITFIAPICDGKYLINFTKPHIETEFWFGESDMGQGLSHDENNKRMNGVMLNIEQYFIDKNMEGINDEINTIKNILSGKSSYKAKHYLHYYSCPVDSPIHGFTIESPYYGSGVSGETYDISNKDLKIILKALELNKERFMTRLVSYLKKYGTKKLHVRSYWIDR
jgi:hypothetical protein